jgi:hypothetical protein
LQSWHAFYVNPGFGLKNVRRNQGPFAQAGLPYEPLPLDFFNEKRSTNEWARAISFASLLAQFIAIIFNVSPDVALNLSTTTASKPVAYMPQPTAWLKAYPEPPRRHPLAPN